jgi:cell wall-associated NlpC family hydrolase
MISKHSWEKMRGSMVAFEALQAQFTAASPESVAYKVTQPLNLYDSPALEALATQAQAGRHLRFKAPEGLDKAAALSVVLWEDDYPGWVNPSDLASLHPTTAMDSPPRLSVAEIQTRIPLAIAFAQAAMTQPNVYLWGGTLGPNYDCSGLVQHAFSTQGIWLPRDAYQQEAFVQRVGAEGDRLAEQASESSLHPEDLVNVLEPGDLIFFGTPVKATHVAIYLGNGTYIHSSGKDQGRNGIGIDSLVDLREQVSRNYYAQVRGAGRVVDSYQSQAILTHPIDS